MAAQHHNGAEAPGQATPATSDNASGQGRVIEGQGTADGADFAAAAAQRKRFEGLRAALALRGHELHQLADGTFLVRRWGLTRDLSDLDAVEAFARQVGAA